MSSNGAGNLKKNAGKVYGKAKELGNAAIGVTQDGLKATREKVQETQYEIRMKLYNPLFPEEYFSDGFDCPKIVVIQDEDSRKDVDVCEGAIGWLSKAAGSEVLHLYEEFVPQSGLTFYPSISCESIYYLNPNQEHRYINLSCYFETIQQDKLTELKNIAYCLGAKECRLESYESKKEMKVKQGNLGAKVKPRVRIKTSKQKDNGSVTGDYSTEQKLERQVVFFQKFEGSDSPVEPKLEWYEHDKEILSLIDMRLNGNAFNATKEYSVSIDSKLSQSIEVNLAAKLDQALEKLSVETNFTLKGESLKESRTKLKFVIVF